MAFINWREVKKYLNCMAACIEIIAETAVTYLVQNTYYIAKIVPDVIRAAEKSNQMEYYMKRDWMTI